MLNLLQPHKCNYSLLSMQSWQELDTRITTTVNEAKENVSHLHNLEKLCDPLYNGDPVRKMLKQMHCILYACKLLYVVN